MSDAVAFEACPQCGQCTVTSSRLPACKNTNEFDAGEGGCETYGMGFPSTNYNYCETDHDSSSKIFGILYAYEACPQCDKCEVSLSPSGLPKCVKTSVFESSHQGHRCSAYALGRPSHEYCRIDYDDSLYQIVYANQACPECGECEGRLSNGGGGGGGGGADQEGDPGRLNVDYETRMGECAFSSVLGTSVLGVNGVDYTRYYGQGLAWCKNLCNRERSHCKAFEYSTTLQECDIWNTLPNDTSYSSAASCHRKKHLIPPQYPERLNNDYQTIASMKKATYSRLPRAIRILAMMSDLATKSMASVLKTNTYAEGRTAGQENSYGSIARSRVIVSFWSWGEILMISALGPNRFRGIY